MRSSLHTENLLRRGKAGRGQRATMLMQELAVALECRSAPTPGMAYARKRDFTEKEKARLEVLRLFTKERWPTGLSIVTMPGIGWEFERMLLLMRERRKRALGDGGKRPERTYICALEREEGIYRAALKTMPGVRHSLVQLPAKADAPLCFRTYAITRFYRMSVEDFITWTPGVFDAAWLDVLARQSGVCHYNFSKAICLMGDESK